MTQRSPQLFPEFGRTRRRPRTLMHVIDAGEDCGLAMERGEKHRVRLGCARCGHESQWTVCLMSVAKRGIPCPLCNEPQQ